MTTSGYQQIVVQIAKNLGISEEAADYLWEGGPREDEVSEIWNEITNALGKHCLGSDEDEQFVKRLIERGIVTKEAVEASWG